MAIWLPEKAGRRCGKLQWVSETGDMIGRYKAWNVLCDCGTVVTLPSRAFNVHISCGCSRRKPEAIKKLNRTRLAKEYRDRRKQKGLCVTGGCPNAAIESQTRCASCRIVQLELGKRDKDRLKSLCFTHYGNICKCCGLMSESFIFLTLDHINNDGNEHRKVNKGSLYRWAVRNGFPATLETSCWNCNIAKYMNGGLCPHKEEVNNFEYIAS